MIYFKDLGIQYGGKILFEGADLLLNHGNRYAIVGANGSGKSTLLRLIAGEEAPSVGEVEIPKDKSIGWVKQDHFQYEQNRIIDVVLMGKTKLWDAMAKKEALLNAEWTDESGYKLSEYEETIAHYDGYTAESLGHKLLKGLGIPQSEHFKPLSILSGGYKMRVLLAQALFNQPDILLLDEPTNHLDIMTIGWLERYLIDDYQGLLAFVSHDIRFLNNISTHILDVDYGEIREYPGNYGRFMLKKKEIMEQKLSAQKYAEDKRAHLQSFVDKFGAKASKAKQAQSRVRMIEKLEMPDVQKSSRVSPRFAFEPKRPSGKQVLTVKNLSKSYGEKNVLNDMSLDIKRQQKVAIMGHNGIGKSTLLKIAMGLEKASVGETEWGHEAQISYFAQDHHEQLNEDLSVYDWLCNNSKMASTGSVRNVLGQVLFTKDEVDKSILHLSGGEAARLLLAKIMLEKPNILILDEPTNHLDVEGIYALTKALRAFTGTVILVSHDRHFVGNIANRIIALTESGKKDYQGGYAEFLKYYGEDYFCQSFLAKQN
tara:strand:+ start:112 stop:1734 length:1623 start_codon:yes stop_codon:yes gene_type:complete